MLDNNKSYRIKANVHEDKVLNVNINQDFSILEVLSLKIDTEGLYKFHTSNYGCVAGRVLANEGFGIPNAKISIFISATTEDLEDDIISYLYPYTSTSTKNEDKIRYNLLPEEQLNECHRNVGTFPSKRMVLDDNNVLEVFDKYYKFTTRTNNAGDYIIFGVPTGNQTIHVDIDLSDIGVLSQKPRDMIYKGYNITQFENANMFKKSTDIDNLAQIITQNQNLYVYPFWGEESESTIAISRKDIDIQYEFTPTCVFMGSLITDERSNGVSKRCIPSERMGKMDKLTTGNGTIEMIRKTIDGDIEEQIIQGNQLIDGNGVWCYQIPMNLDYVRTDEYGNMVPTDDITKGIPTRTSVRFRLSLTEFETENEYSHLSKVLVPNNPASSKKYKCTKCGHIENENFEICPICGDNNKSEHREEIEGTDYTFGSKTRDDSFKDLFWNDVYTVKSYIPRIQMLNFDRNKRFSGIKAVNVNNSNNPIPYNNMRINLTFMFSLQCAIFKILLWVIGTLNRVVSIIAGADSSNIGDKFLDNGGRCVYIGDGYCQNMEGWYFAPKCTHNGALENAFSYLIGGLEEKEIQDISSVDYKNRNEEEKICLSNNITYFIQCVELTFAMEYDVIQFDFYNDWINGLIYMPRWFADIRKKKSFLFGAITIKPKINACMENAKLWFQRRYVQQCAMEYDLSNNSSIVTPKGCKNDSSQRCHKSHGRKFKKLFKNGGLVHNEKVSTGEYAYYFKPCEWVDNGFDGDVKCNLFAADIVLLGSLDKNNPQGIPQTFKKLVSSSYQMPDPLASTNLGEEGYVYTGDKNNGTLCTSNKNYYSNGIIRQTPTLENVADWSTYQLNNEDKNLYDKSELYDEKEYAVTEAAGIDWGYIGPNQNTDNANNIKKGIYFPGGHFLGISCGQSESNIKSCINLSRICEMGTLMSQRQSIVRRTSGGTYTYSYLIPTGLISGDEINDYGFKNEFATLNYNGLKTKKNLISNLTEYDFETITPINFSGELRRVIPQTDKDYNDLNGFNDNEINKGKTPAGDDYNSWAYKRTIEENSNDYYKFRLNLHYGDTVSKKYLNRNGYKVSLPMYENSFYFYFGLKNGNTALDNFYKDFFAECPSNDEYNPSVSVTITNSKYCETQGSITVVTKGIENPYIRTAAGVYKMESDIETFTAKTGTTEFYVGGDNLEEEFYKKVNILTDKPSVFSEVDYTVKDYTGEVNDMTVDKKYGGSITFNSHTFSNKDLAAIAVVSNFSGTGTTLVAEALINTNCESRVIEKCKGMIRSGFSLFNGEASFYSVSDESNTQIYFWVGNRYYNIILYYACDENNIKMESINSIYVNMPKETDIIFNNDNIASYKSIILPMLNKASDDSERKYILENWFDILLTGTTANKYYNAVGEYFRIKYGGESINYLNRAKRDAARAIFYQNPRSLIENAYGGVGINIVATVPYETVIGGSYEMLGGNVLNISNAPKEGYAEPSYKNFISPTRDAPNTAIYYLTDYSIAGDTKVDYKLRIIDENKAYPSGIGEYITLPSFYRPFFFRAMYIEIYRANQVGSDTIFQIAVANTIGTNVKYSATTVNDTGMTSYVGIDYGVVTEAEPYRYESQYKTHWKRVTKYGIVTNGAREVEAQDSYGNSTNKSVSVKFIGDSEKLYESYDSRVKYYYYPSFSAQTEQNKFSLSNLSGVTIWNSDHRIQYNQSYWGNSSNTPIWNDALSTFIQSQYPEVKTDKIWTKQIDFIPPESIVVGIYDSNYAYNGYTPSFDGNITINSKNMEPRHQNSISVIRIYNSKEFKDLIINGY